MIGEGTEELGMCNRRDPEAAGHRNSCNPLPFPPTPRHASPLRARRRARTPPSLSAASLISAALCYDGVFMKHILTLAVVAPLALWSVSCKKAEPPKPAPAPPAAAAAAAAGSRRPGVPGAPAAPKPMPPQIPDVLARVNGEKIERWEFDNAVKRMEARAGGPVPPDKRDEVLRGVLDQLVAYHLLAQESRARKLAGAGRRRRRAARRHPQERSRPRTRSSRGSPRRG